MFEYAEIMLFNVAKDNVEACNLANKYPEIVQKLKDELLSSANFKEYVKWNKNAQSGMSKQGTMAQANSYDCDKKRAYHVSWHEMGGYENEEDLTWSFKQIFYKYLYNIDHCARYGTKATENSFFSFSFHRFGHQSIGIALIALVSLAAYLFVIFGGFFNNKETKKILNDDASPNELTALVS